MGHKSRGKEQEELLPRRDSQHNQAWLYCRYCRLRWAISGAGSLVPEKKRERLRCLLIHKWPAITQSHGSEVSQQVVYPFGHSCNLAVLHPVRHLAVSMNDVTLRHRQQQLRHPTCRLAGCQAPASQTGDVWDCTQEVRGICHAG